MGRKYGIDSHCNNPLTLQVGQGNRFSYYNEWDKKGVLRGTRTECGITLEFIRILN